jgi:hypothetical protein
MGMIVSSLAGPVVQNAAPTTGATVVINDNASDTLLVLDPAGTLATLTVTLPSEANSRIKQVVRIASTRIITAITINGATTIIGAPVGLALGDNLAFQKIKANTWSRQN